MWRSSKGKKKCTCIAGEWLICQMFTCLSICCLHGVASGVYLKYSAKCLQGSVAIVPLSLYKDANVRINLMLLVFFSQQYFFYIPCSIHNVWLCILNKSFALQISQVSTFCMCWGISNPNHFFIFMSKQRMKKLGLSLVVSNKTHVQKLSY